MTYYVTFIKATGGVIAAIQCPDGQSPAASDMVGVLQTAALIPDPENWAVHDGKLLKK